MKIDYKKNAIVMEMIKKAPLFTKNATTFFRKPKPEELGTTIFTYVKNPDNDGYRQEAQAVICGSRVIAKNGYVVAYNESGEPIYNEWTKPVNEIILGYGQDCIDSLTYEYKEFKQIRSIRMLKLTPEIMEILGLGGHKKLLIDVIWSVEPMVALIGDYITENGYSVSQMDVKLMYQEIKESELLF